MHANDNYVNLTKEKERKTPKNLKFEILRHQNAVCFKLCLRSIRCNSNSDISSNSNSDISSFALMVNEETRR